MLHTKSPISLCRMFGSPSLGEDFDWTSLCEDEDPIFAWLGNGFIVEECKENIEEYLT